MSCHRQTVLQSPAAWHVLQRIVRLTSAPLPGVPVWYSYSDILRSLRNGNSQVERRKWIITKNRTQNFKTVRSCGLNYLNTNACNGYVFRARRRKIASLD